MAGIARVIQSAIVIGKARRDWVVPFDSSRMKLWDFHHILAFHMCISRANKYVRDWADHEEIATVVAEDVPEKRQFLKEVLKVKMPDLDLGDESMFHAKTGSDTNPGPIDRIVDTVHFCAKDEAPLLQIADACAFSFRRYLSAQSHGEQLLQEMLGEKLNWQDWQGPISNVTTSFHPLHRYPKANS